MAKPMDGSTYGNVLDLPSRNPAFAKKLRSYFFVVPNPESL